MTGQKANGVGFSLIEVMIVMVIIGILMLVAVPLYEDGMKKSRRTDGMRDLMELAARQERFYAQYSVYTNDIASAAGLNLQRTTSPEDPEDPNDLAHYDLAVALCAGEADFSACYVLQAVPVPEGLQAKDKCATLSVDSKGQRSASGPLGDACW